MLMEDLRAFQGQFGLCLILPSVLIIDHSLLIDSDATAQ